MEIFIWTWNNKNKQKGNISRINSTLCICMIRNILAIYESIFIDVNKFAWFLWNLSHIVAFWTIRCKAMWTVQILVNPYGKIASPIGNIFSFMSINNFRWTFIKSIFNRFVADSSIQIIWVGRMHSMKPSLLWKLIQGNVHHRQRYRYYAVVAKEQRIPASIIHAA